MVPGFLLFSFFFLVSVNDWYILSLTFSTTPTHFLWKVGCFLSFMFIFIVLNNEKQYSAFKNKQCNAVSVCLRFRLSVWVHSWTSNKVNLNYVSFRVKLLKAVGVFECFHWPFLSMKANEGFKETLVEHL